MEVEDWFGVGEAPTRRNSLTWCRSILHNCCINVYDPLRERTYVHKKQQQQKITDAWKNKSESRNETHRVCIRNENDAAGLFLFYLKKCEGKIKKNFFFSGGD